MPVVEFGGDDTAALAYIRERGYCSYSSMKNVRDKCDPSPGGNESWFKFGRELHSRLLENRKLLTLSDAEEKQLEKMLLVLRLNPVISSLLKDAQNEVDFGPQSVLDKYKSKSKLVIPHLYGIPVYGRIDSLNTRTNSVSDLKSTRLSNMKQFVDEMDFLQAALYTKVSGMKNFYYWGICKQPPYTVMVFNVNQYPQRVAAAQQQLRQLLMYIKSKL